MDRMVSDSPLPSDERLAFSVLTAFLVSIFFLPGGIANTVAILSFVAAWIALTRDPQIQLSNISPLTILFITAISLRLLLPPYGAENAVPGAAITRSLLIVGLYGLTLYAYARLPFRYILLLVVIVAFACTVASFAMYVFHGKFHKRLEFLGRAQHSIIGAGAIATAVLAAVTCLLSYIREDASRLKMMLISGVIIVFLGALAMTGSRGPVMALAIALAATPIVLRSRSPLTPIAFAFGAWVIVTSSIVFEAQIHEALCPTIEFACRPSLRQGVWSATAAMIAQHPLWGVGYGFRFEGVPHAHNTYFGMALNYGIPLLLLFVALMATALARTTRMAHKDERFFVVAGLIFANGFMGSDLSDPMRFFNTHYLFLWFPLILALISDKDDEPLGSLAARPSSASRQ
jgi:O-antigen ligase